MSWEEYLDFFYDAVNVDLKALYGEYRWLEKLLVDGSKIRITGPGTDLSIGIKGRTCRRRQ